jgi:hypothetical protein
MWLRKIQVYPHYYLSNLWKGRINESNIKISSSCESLLFAVSIDVLLHLSRLGPFSREIASRRQSRKSKRAGQSAKKSDFASASTYLPRGHRTENLLCVHWNEINFDLMPSSGSHPPL